LFSPPAHTTTNKLDHFFPIISLDFESSGFEVNPKITCWKCILNTFVLKNRKNISANRKSAIMKKFDNVGLNIERKKGRNVYLKGDHLFLGQI